MSASGESFSTKLFCCCCALTPHVFLACEQPGTTFGVRPSGVLIMRKLCKPVDPRTKAEYASEPVPEPVQCDYRWHLLSEPGILGNANGICAEVVRNRSQMSVR